MPEGDTIFRAARTLRRALAGHIITRFESVYPLLTRIDHDTPLAGRRVIDATARGKHLLMTFEGDLILHTHMRMHGSWHIYKTGERWRAPARDMRIVIATQQYVAVGFNIPVAEFLSSASLARHTQIQELGPDLTDPGFDRQEVVRRLRARDDAPLHEALLDQRVLSGIGNVLKSEVLYVARVNPFRHVSTIDDATFDRIMDVSLRLMKMNIDEGHLLKSSIGRRTTGSLDPGVKLFVYGRGGKPCRRCGAPIQASKTGRDARLTYWCPRCQPA